MKKIRKQSFVAIALAVSLSGSLLGGCGKASETAPMDEMTMTEQNTESAAVSETAAEQNPEADAFLDGTETADAENNVIPCVAPYTVNPDLSNVTNLDLFYIEPDSELAKKLVRNGFAVAGQAGSEFFEIYEMNRYTQIPNFVTVDSLMHTYHLYFSYLLKNIERDYLADSLKQLSSQLFQNTAEQYEQLKGSEWEGAAGRNLAFFAVGLSLLEGKQLTECDAVKTAGLPEDIAALAQEELDKIMAAEEIAQSVLTGDFEDYSQYVPRGYYEGDAKLEAYFRAMMWYGRTHFKQEKEDLDRSAFLLTLALAEDLEAYEQWRGIYAVTSFFTGTSDDLGAPDYEPVIEKIYGADVSVKDLPGTEEKFAAFHAMTAELRPPQLNSIPIKDGEENTIPGFRFMGQRFTVDGMIMQKLIYSDVKENPEGLKRMLPDVLDVPAALGSKEAMTILEESGATAFEGYPEHLELLQAIFAEEDNPLWSASLSAGWLHTLRPLLTPKTEGYPMFMQNREWTRKNLECFAGSFAELKHDTILYSKQVIAEMGGGFDENIDDRGYVEPEPQVYGRFAALSRQTAAGLQKYDMLKAADAENLERLSEIAEQLLTISNKELQDQVLTEEEYEFIKTYGGSLEHFWYEVVKEESDSEYIDSSEFPAAIVADIATDPNGQVLEAATGNPSRILVLVNVDGKLKLARGSVYSFYQFAWPLENRLTDTKWRQMMGFEVGEDGMYQSDRPIAKPEWTESYRYHYEWE